MLYGCSRPVILRRYSDESYRLITYTYTHGVRAEEGGDDDDGDDQNKNNTRPITKAIARLETRQFCLR